MTLLDSAGFMEPLRSTIKTAPDCQYLSKGRYLVIGRPPPEDQLIKRLPGAISNQVGIYHYATVKCTKFRDNSVEENNMKEKASVININNTICKIMYFINAIIGDKNHELTFGQCYGNPAKSYDPLCFFVLLTNQVNRIFSVQSYGNAEKCSMCYFVLLNKSVNLIFSISQMSTPLIHATDNNALWIL